MLPCGLLPLSVNIGKQFRGLIASFTHAKIAGVPLADS